MFPTNQTYYSDINDSESGMLEGMNLYNITTFCQSIFTTDIPLHGSRKLRTHFTTLTIHPSAVLGKGSENKSTAIFTKRPEDSSVLSGNT